MIAYRAETAMVQTVRQKMTRHDDARSLLRAIYSTEADILPESASHRNHSPSASTRLPTNPLTMPSDISAISQEIEHCSPEPSYATEIRVCPLDQAC